MSDSVQCHTVSRLSKLSTTENTNDITSAGVLPQRNAADIEDIDDVDVYLGVKGLMQHIPYTLLTQLADDSKYLHLWRALGGGVFYPEATVHDILGGHPPTDFAKPPHPLSSRQTVTERKEKTKTSSWASVVKTQPKDSTEKETESKTERKIKMTVLTKMTLKQLERKDTIENTK